MEAVDVFYNSTTNGLSQNNAARYVGMSFGFRFTQSADQVPEATVRFAHAKLERGKVPTDSSLTFAEMWHEFNNANYLNAVPISNKVNPLSPGSLKQGQGLIYDTNNWVNKYIATGGGGGFVAQAYPPDKYFNSENELVEYDSSTIESRRQLLWYVFGTAYGKCEIPITDSASYDCYEGAFYFFDGQRWVPCESNYVVDDKPPMNTAKLWLDTKTLRSNYDAAYGPNEPADLKYYDPKYEK